MQLRRLASTLALLVVVSGGEISAIADEPATATPEEQELLQFALAENAAHAGKIRSVKYTFKMSGWAPQKKDFPGAALSADGTVVKNGDYSWATWIHHVKLNGDSQVNDYGFSELISRDACAFWLSQRASPLEYFEAQQPFQLPADAATRRCKELFINVREFVEGNGSTSLSEMYGHLDSKTQQIHVTKVRLSDGGKGLQILELKRAQDGTFYPLRRWTLDASKQCVVRRFEWLRGKLTEYDLSIEYARYDSSRRWFPAAIHERRFDPPISDALIDAATHKTSGELQVTVSGVTLDPAIDETHFRIDNPDFKIESDRLISVHRRDGTREMCLLREGELVDMAMVQKLESMKRGSGNRAPDRN